ncbi:MAG: RNA-binding S4 domain-containing protein [Gemmatimonadota bacterium]|nr:RNA-binding S4 domain-containing protein [Gemmatimonadota bacterium]
MTTRPTLDKMRLDRWLWAARFYKTRSLAAAAIDGGKVQRNGTRVKRASVVHVGDTIRIRKPPFEFTLEVTALSGHRGSATVAQHLYHETSESVAQRELLRTQLRTEPRASFDGKGRPTKKERRQIDRFKRGR